MNSRIDDWYGVRAGGYYCIWDFMGHDDGFHSGFLFDDAGILL
jgi:hypothetical protein